MIAGPGRSNIVHELGDERQAAEIAAALEHS